MILSGVPSATFRPGYCTLSQVLSAFTIALLLTGCRVGPDFSASTLPRMGEPISPQSNTVATVVAVPADWWRLFNDDTLTDLETRASTGNLTIQEATARYFASRAQLDIVGAESLPAIEADGGYNREKLSANGELAALGAPTRPYNYWQTAFNAQWELDLWGHARRQSEAAKAESDAADREIAAARVSISAEIARAYIVLRGLQTRLKILDQNIGIARHTLFLAESRQRNGIGSRFDPATAKAHLSGTEALRLDCAHQRNAAMNALARLLGLAPQTLNRELGQALPSPRMPERLPAGIPADLARRRPDILRAEADLHAATAAIGAAKADFYPRVTLVGSFGLQAFDLEKMGVWGSRQFGVGPSVYLPIFEGGRLKGNLALREARQKEAAIAYRAAVLNAWHEIDDAIDAYNTEVARHAKLENACRQNQDAFRIAERSYQEGASDYLTVLVAQRDLLSSQSSLADNATATGLSLVALYKSLASGWSAGSSDALSSESAP